METDFYALSTSQKKVWATQVWIAGRDNMFYFAKGLVGKNDNDINAPITRVTELTETERGRECVFTLVHDLRDDGVVGDNKLTNNEEAMQNENVSIRIDQIRHGVKSRGRMSEQGTVVRFRATAKERLSYWLSERMDQLITLTLSGRAYSLNINGTTRVGSQFPQLAFAADVAAATSGRIIHAGAATSEATIAASEKMSWDTIVRAKATAERKQIRPLRIKGEEHYVMLISTEQARDLALDSTYQTITSRAGVRGDDNPLFKGALAVVHGVIVRQHNKLFNTLGLGSGSKWGAGGAVDGAQGLLLGAQAAAFATIGNTKMAESELTDYENQIGLGIGRIFGLLKPQWQSPADSYTTQDFGVVSVKTAAAA